jgi:hypothetical protein
MNAFPIGSPVYIVTNEDAGIHTITGFPVIAGETCVELKTPEGLYKTVELGDIALSRGNPNGSDAINPIHYKGNGVECIDAIKAQMSREEFLGYLRGNVTKYTFRMRQKGDPVENARKANWYLDRLMQELAQ